MTANFLVKFSFGKRKYYGRKINSVNEGIHYIKRLIKHMRNYSELSETKIIGGWITE